MEGTFVGRGPELATLVEGYRETVRGHGGLFLVVGEPGIGKTRLCDELCAVAGAQGASVFWGRAWEGGGAPAYFPIQQLLRGLLRALGRDAFIALTRAEHGELVPLLPELSDASLPMPAREHDTSDTRVRLGIALCSLLARAAERQPLVAVLDDLHAADVSSIVLLRFLARELRGTRVLLLVTYRDVEVTLQPENARAIAELTREGRSLLLRRLDREATCAFVQQIAGPVQADVLHALHEATQGNPLFVDEVARLLLLEGGFDRARSVAELPIPYGVREAIRMRLLHLGDASRELLGAASALGSELWLPVLAEVASAQVSEVERALVEGVRAGVVRSLGGDRYGFCHPLIREVVYRELPRDRRIALHTQIADVLQRRGSAHDAAHAEIAHHLLEAGTPDHARLVREVSSAVDQAGRLGAYDDAAQLLTRAAQAVDAAHAEPALRFELWLQLSRTRVVSGERALGRAACERALALARDLRDPERLALAALAFGADFAPGMVDEMLVSLLTEALTVLPSTSLGLRARVMARLAAARQPSLDPYGEVALAKQAIALARTLDDPELLLEVEYAAMGAFMDYDDPRQRLILNLEIEQRAAALGDHNKVWRSCVRLVFDYIESGDLPLTLSRIARLEELVKRPGWAARAYVPLLCRAMCCSFTGDFDGAEAFDARALVVIEAHNLPDARFVWMMHRFAFYRIADRGDELRAAAPEFIAVLDTIPSARPYSPVVPAMLAAREGDTEAARTALGRMSLQTLMHFFDVIQIFATEVAAEIGHAELARGLYPLLQARGEYNVSWGASSMACEGSAERILGLLAGTFGDLELAVAHFERGQARDRAVGARPSLARTLLDHGRLLRRLGGEAQRTRADALLTDAHTLATQLGMRFVAARAAALLATDATDTQDGAAPGPLPLRAAQGRAEESSRALPCTLALEGEFWTVTCDEGVFRLKDSRGLQMLSRLLAEPGRELHAVDLMGGAADTGSGHAGELIDREAREAYRERMLSLREELSEAEAFGDLGRSERAQHELDSLSRELSRAVGLGGRERQAGSTAERARVAVQRRVREAIRRIAAHAPKLSNHLDRSVRTGAFCVYEPAPRGA
jgi:hypothetical protein